MREKMKFLELRWKNPEKIGPRPPFGGITGLQYVYGGY